MRKKREIESSERRSARLDNRALERDEDKSAEDRALDAAVQRSIRQFGA